MMDIEKEIARKAAYTSGYEQAEKDLALTWEDMKKLDNLMNEVEAENTNALIRGKNIPFDSDELFYGEVLERFNEQRKK